MTRWEPDARGRLESSALDLFLERGFERTTVQEIATRTGLTERTFFRHFSDKREVLFYAAQDFHNQVVTEVSKAPEGEPPLGAVLNGFRAASHDFQARKASIERRQRIIDLNSELEERELIKMSNLTSAVAQTLRDRGVDEMASRVASEAGLLIFRTAFDEWLKTDDSQKLEDLIGRATSALVQMSSTI